MTTVRKCSLIIPVAVLSMASAGCRSDSLGAPPEPVSRVPLAALHAAEDETGFSAWSEPVSLGPLINSGFGDQNAALSRDGLSLYFASNRPGLGGTDIWVSHRADPDAPWSDPVNLGPPINSAANEGAPDVSSDGHWLFFHSNRPGGMGATDLWASYRRNVHDDMAWEAPVNLGPGINTDAAENAPNYFENEDGDAPQLFFTRGPTASSDIYVSRLGADGSWGPPSPVTELNDPVERDGSPSISRDGLRMYFDSNRDPPRTHIFVATRESVRAPWSIPVELGAPIRTADGEFLPYFLSRGNTETLVFTRDADHDGIFDLWQSTRTRTHFAAGQGRGGSGVGDLRVSAPRWATRTRLRAPE